MSALWHMFSERPVLTVFLSPHSYTPPLPRSDASHSVEGHYADACAMVTSTYSVTDVAASAAKQYVCEIDLPCTNGWSLYTDDGSEGADSCVHSGTYFSSGVWSDGRALCPKGAHSPTFGGPLGSEGLPLFTAQLYSALYVYMGCLQDATATQRARGWSWADGTPDFNLNCGTGAGGDGCGMWAAGEAK